jgi:ABC-2 type transport system ATP-binding protein
MNRTPKLYHYQRTWHRNSEAPAGRQSLLEARGLTKCYASIPAVDDVSFTIRPGEILGYLGPNGSGKSTTVKMITGLLEPTRGHVLFRGVDINDDLPVYKNLLGYVPEEAMLYPYLTGWEYLDFVGTLRGMNRGQLKSRSQALLQLFSLYPHRHAPIASYSKGMRQRILLIAALMHDPMVLVFDEPLSGLDVTSAMIFRKLVKSLGDQGKIVFYCSHMLEVVEKLCSHLLILRLGKVVASGSVGAVREMTGMASLEDSFSHLVEERNAEEIAHNIVEVMGAA